MDNGNELFMKILFIVHENFSDANFFPLNIGYLAAAAKEGGHNVVILHQDIYHHSNNEIVDIINMFAFDFDVICISFLSARFSEVVLPLCKELKRVKNGNPKLILGGHGASATPEYILEATGADAVVVGEAESLFRANTLHDLSGVVNNFSKMPINKIPYPEWSLFPMEKYTTGIQYPGMTKDDRIMSVITSRGCVNRCTFCYRMEKGWRPRKKEDVDFEMECLNIEYGVNYFEFQDEVLAPSYKRLEDIIGFDLGFDYKFACSLRVDEITEDVCQLLKERGCQYVTIGFESMNDDVLAEYDKNVTSKDNIQAAELMKKYEIPMGINFIWGAPSDTANDLWESMKFIRRYTDYCELRTIRPVTPYPGCQLYHRAINDGLLSGPADFYRKFKNSDRFTVNFTQYGNEQLYWYLYQANKTLIWDYYNHVNRRGGWGMTKDFYRLYFKNPDYKFRGARKYERE
jgi:radical SAM superfamily enzyme YgiQ (UPF0313 family)